MMEKHPQDFKKQTNKQTKNLTEWVVENNLKIMLIQFNSIQFYLFV